MLQKIYEGQELKINVPIPVKFIKAGIWKVMKINSTKGTVQIKNSEYKEDPWPIDTVYWVSMNELCRKASEI
jgi:hypothetical protein